MPDVTATASNAIGVGKGDEQACCLRLDRFAADTEESRQTVRFRQDPVERGPIERLTISGARDRLETGAAIRVGTGRSTPHHIALAEQCGNCAGRARMTERARAEEHVRKTRVNSESGHLASVRRDASVLVDRVELA